MNSITNKAPIKIVFECDELLIIKKITIYQILTRVQNEM